MGLFKLGETSPALPAAGAAWVAPTAVLIGDVRLAPGASVWFGSILRGDNEPMIIGADSNIQDGCVLHSDPGQRLTVGAGVTVGHAVVLHGCRIGDNSLIGMGSVILNGARIGRDCLVGAGTLITEGKIIPDGSVVMGRPGKVVRQVTPEEQAGFLRSAQSYCANWRRYEVGLSRV
jgi:carbonic anhydrase/acetyltransferase-like protein (isoleucine patch superfamily)